MGLAASALRPAASALPPALGSACSYAYNNSHHPDQALLRPPRPSRIMCVDYHPIPDCMQIHIQLYLQITVRYTNTHHHCRDFLRVAIADSTTPKRKTKLQINKFHFSD